MRSPHLKKLAIGLCLLLLGHPVAAEPLIVAAEPSACVVVEGGLLVADDELVGSVLLCPGTAPTTVPCRVVKLERDTALAPSDEPPSKSVALQDVEGLAADGSQIYLIGSHQGKVKAKRRLDREFLIHAKWKSDDEELEIKDTRYDLFDVIVASIKDELASGDALLTNNDFSRLNLEGLTLCGSRLIVGLRSPRNAAGRALILSAPPDQWFANPAGFRPELLALDLKSDGVRALDCAGDLLIVLSGPEGDSKDPQSTLWLYDLSAKSLVRAPTEVQAVIKPTSTGKNLAPEGVCALGDDRFAIVAEGEGSGSAEIRSTHWAGLSQK